MDARLVCRELVAPDQDTSTGVLSRLAGGDPSALDELMEQYWSQLVAYATRLLGSPDAADDVVQSVFVRLWERRHVRVAEASITSYLFRATRNLVIDEQRRRRVRAAWATSQAAIEWRHPANPLEEAEADDLRKGLTRALESLPPRRREVLELARFHDLSYKEIADVMGISPQTVANQMSAALTQIRAEIEPYLEVTPAPPERTRSGWSERT